MKKLDELKKKLVSSGLDLEVPAQETHNVRTPKLIGFRSPNKPIHTMYVYQHARKRDFLKTSQIKLNYYCFHNPHIRCQSSFASGMKRVVLIDSYFVSKYENLN